MSDSRKLKHETAITALGLLLGEYKDRKSQFGSDYLWRKHEDAEGIAWVESVLASMKEDSLESADDQEVISKEDANRLRKAMDTPNLQYAVSQVERMVAAYDSNLELIDKLKGEREEARRP